MSQLWWLQRNNRRRLGQNKQTDLTVSGSKVTVCRSTCRGQIADWHYHFCLLIRRFILEICGVECASRGKSGTKFDVFVPQIWGKGPEIYADEIKQKNITAVKYNGIDLGGHNNFTRQNTVPVLTDMLNNNVTGLVILSVVFNSLGPVV